MKSSILIAGVAGASLGTEICKALSMTDRYHIYGSDISSNAYGHYMEEFEETILVDKDNYVDSTIEACLDRKIEVIIPGGEQPLHLIATHADRFEAEGIVLAINKPEVISLCGDKLASFEFLKRSGISIPQTYRLDAKTDVESLVYPCIIKPSQDHGGSVFTYLAEDVEDAHLYSKYLEKREVAAVIQEYISDAEGEFTIGVLSLPNSDVLGSVALKRSFASKLSVSFKRKGRTISSGYSQGLIDDFDRIRQQAETIARIVGSCGPLNIQGRVRNGILFPFEINPRFSATTYLRALAGFNEVDAFLRFLLENRTKPIGIVNKGYYLRGLSERYVPVAELKND